MLISVAVTVVCVAAAGAPGLLSASGSLGDAQDRVDQATLNQRIIALTHSLADEREDLVVYAAAGRTGGDGSGSDGDAQEETDDTGLTPSQRARLERQIAAVSGADAVPAAVKRRLARLPEARRRAAGDEASALETYKTYTATIQRLQAVTRDGAGTGASAQALPYLDRAVEQASGTRGLLHAALAEDGSQPDLTAAAEQARVREQGAQADFEAAAGTGPRDTFDKTVTGSDVNAAQRYLRRLTERSTPGPADWSDVDPDRTARSLAARVGLMRGVHSSLAAAEVRSLEGARDDEVTAAELRVALVAGCLLLALAVSVQTARSLARPLAALRRGARQLADDPAGAEPVPSPGRDDEFADVVSALNRLRDTAVALRERGTGGVDAPGGQTGALRAAEAAAVPPVPAVEVARLRAEHAALARESAARVSGPGSPVAVLGQRTLGLIEQLLSVIESLEADETDPGRLGTLFTLDHLVTRTRRHSEGLLLLAGAARRAPHHDGPVPLLDVLRAAVSETEQYERVRLAPLPPQAYVSEGAADDVSHLVAELLDNATAFSAPESEAQLTGWLLQNGEIMLSVQDQGTGMTGERLAELNDRLAASVPPEPAGLAGEGGGSAGLGLHVAARLAVRHELRVQLRRQKRGGIAAMVILPLGLLSGTEAGGTQGAEPGAVGAADGGAEPGPGLGADLGAGAVPGAADEAGGTASLPGPAAEEHPDALPVRRRRSGSVNAPPPALARGVSPPVPVPRPRHESPPDDGEPTADGPEHPEGTGRQEHGQASAATPPVSPEPLGSPESPGSPAPGVPAPGVTGTGLPKRTPKPQRKPAPATGQEEAAVSPQRKGGADPDELRRRLGGLQRGAQDGRRDAAAEIAAERGVTDEEALP